MSQRDELKDMLFEQLADLEIFERLLRFDPARQKLFLCVATLSSRGKPLASQLQQTYTGRYKPEPADDTITAQTTSTATVTSTPSTSASAAATTTATTIKTASKLAKLAKAKLALNCKSHNHATNSSSATTSDNTSTSILNTSPSTSSATCNNTSDVVSSTKLLDTIALKDADYIKLADDPVNDFPFGLDVIDFGLRLGSFLSEAGWMSESIDILKCVASRLKRMTLDKKLKIIYLDCLQRYQSSSSSYAISYLCVCELI